MKIEIKYHRNGQWSLKKDGVQIFFETVPWQKILDTVLQHDSSNVVILDGTKTTVGDLPVSDPKISGDELDFFAWAQLLHERGSRK